MPREPMGPPRGLGVKDWSGDYKDMNTLQKACSPQGKLYDRKRLGTTAKVQRRLKRAVKRARFLALLRYVGRG